MYTVNDGLSQSSVYDFYQDKTGFLWIGTGDGLNRFDGYDFKVFKHLPTQPHSLSESTVRGIIEDAGGRLWVGSERGMSIYDPAKGTFTPWSVPGFRNDCYMPFAVHGNYLYFSIRNKAMYKMDLRDGKYSNIAPGILSLRTENTASDNSSVWYTSIDNHVCRLDLQSGNIDSFPHAYKGEVVDVKLLRNSYLAIISADDLTFLDKHTGRRLSSPCPALLEGRPIRTIMQDSYGHIWVSVTGEGIYLCTKDWQLIKKYTEAENAYSSMPFQLNNVISFYEDRSGNVWFGTDGAGMGRIRYNRLKFKERNGLDGYEYPLSVDFVKCFYEDGQGRLYVGTHQYGINVIDSRTHQISYIYPAPGDKSNNSPNTINSIIAGESDSTLLAGTDNGLFLINTYTRGMRCLKPVSSQTPFRIYCLYRSAVGKVLISSSVGLFTLEKSAGQWQLHFIGDLHTIISRIYPDSKGGYIVCSSYHGLFYWDGASGLKPIDSTAAYEKRNGNILFKCLLWSGKGRIWAATNSGLFQLDTSFGVRKAYGLEEGLPDLFIYGILSDKRGNLWMSTNKGLSSFNPQTSKFTNYKIEDGLQSYEFNSGAYYKDPSGRMFFGGVNGFNAFYPENIQPNTQAPPVALVSMSLFDEPLPVDSILSRGRALNLPWDKNTLSFELAGLEYTLPSQNQYAFHLEGLEDGWFQAGNKRFIRYSALKPGDYTLWACAANADGVWGVPQKLLSISIRPPFWRTWWFISFGVVVLGGFMALLAFLVTSARYRKKLAEVERQREIMEIRSRISRDIHDDIGAGLTRLSILSQRLRSGKYREAAEMNQSLEKLAQQSQEIVHNLGEIVWTVNPQHDQLNSMLAYLRNFAAEFLENAGIDYHFDFPEEVPELQLHPDLRRNLFLVVKECINNIVKHAAANKVVITFTICDQAYRISIHDNGCGIRKQNDFGNGLRNMKQRMETIGASLEVVSGNGCGTEVTIQGMLF